MASSLSRLLLALPLLAACDATGPNKDELRVTVQQPVLTAPATIRFMVTNSARSIVEFTLCDGHIAAAIEPIVPGTPAIEPACSFPGTPFQLKSGASALDSVSVGAAGVYRLRVGYGRPPSRVLYQVASDTITVH